VLRCCERRLTLQPSPKVDVAQDPRKSCRRSPDVADRERDRVLLSD
jgi:hypothetical protein